MPEGIEVEIYRKAAERTVGRTISEVEAPDAWFIKGGPTPEAVVEAVSGQRIEAARRIGKLLILDLSSGLRLGLRFGMTGRLIVDDGAPIDQLEYSSDRNDPAWDRFVLHFDDGELRLRDPRRLGAVELDPDETKLGADAFSITEDQLRQRVLVGKVALKTRLLDQKRIAGIGNLLADEVLWRAGLDPARPADGLDEVEIEQLHASLTEVLADLSRNGGSHTGQLQDSRFPGAHCPRDGEPLLRRTVGGRTTYSCPQHQR